MMKRHLVLFILAIAALFAVACDDTAEEGMAIFGVSDINGNEPVVVSTADGSGGVVSMTFRWRPYFDTEGSITEAYPHGDYNIEHYRITWTRVSAGSGVIGARETTTSIFVPVYDLVPAGIIVVTPDEAATMTAGTILNANIEFTAREMGTDRDAKFSATVSVTFN